MRVCFHSHIIVNGPPIEHVRWPYSKMGGRRTFPDQEEQERTEPKQRARENRTQTALGYLDTKQVGPPLPLI